MPQSPQNHHQKYTTRLALLNPAQRRAVDTIEGPVLVIAGPGSGKTELLSLRVANILKNTDTLASSILCLTFTDSAAVNMRKRLAGLIGPDAYKVAIHTFHSFGAEIINQNPEFFYEGALYNPADQLTQYEILGDIFENLDHTCQLNSYHPEQGYTYIKDTLNRIGELKKSGLSPEEFLSIIKENVSFLTRANKNISDFFSDRISKKAIDTIQTLISDLQEHVIESAPPSQQRP
ncbi:UvrD-helicase domain-containing protein, partial [Patescibacteria group bacterium]|nr:UvrD-helicase domain-containing protein [Patescibacteria group bacterium]